MIVSKYGKAALALPINGLSMDDVEVREQLIMKAKLEPHTVLLVKLEAAGSKAELSVPSSSGDEGTDIFFLLSAAPCTRHEVMCVRMGGWWALDNGCVFRGGGAGGSRPARPLPQGKGLCVDRWNACRKGEQISWDTRDVCHQMCTQTMQARVGLGR